MALVGKCASGFKIWQTRIDDEQVNDWVPLHLREKNFIGSYKRTEGNTDCGAQCLAFLKQVSEEDAFLLGRLSTVTGLTTKKEVNVALSMGIGESIDDSKQIDLDEEDCDKFFKSVLNEGCGTLIGLSKSDLSQMGHFVVLRKKINGTLQLLCPQQSIGIEGNVFERIKPSFQYVIYPCVEDHDSILSGKRKKSRNMASTAGKTKSSKTNKSGPRRKKKSKVSIKTV